jgi:DNA-binding response OmpR family regulator
VPAVRGHLARFLAARCRGYRDAMYQPTRILLVADRPEQTDATQQALAQEHFEIVAAPNFSEAYDRLLDSIFDLIVIETGEPARTSIEFIRRVRAAPQLAGILILVVAEWGTGAPTLALSAGADAYEPTGPNEGKPISSIRLITSIERLLSREVAAAN